MPDMNSAPQNELPSSAQLLRSTLIAAAVAVVLLVTVVLPAEYGVDPTRIGRVLGLTQMGEIKVSLEKEAAAADSAEAAARLAGGGTVAALAAVASEAPEPAASQTAKSDVTEFTLQPNEGAEIKLDMRKDARVSYSWSVAGGAVNYDTHADAPGISYHGYGKGAGQRSDQGVLVAAFDGAHGWFWRNRGTAAVTLTLRTNGEYAELKRM